MTSYQSCSARNKNFFAHELPLVKECFNRLRYIGKFSLGQERMHRETDAFCYSSLCVLKLTPFLGPPKCPHPVKRNRIIGTGSYSFFIQISNELVSYAGTDSHSIEMIYVG